ncbi:hypothetical protein [Streptomyces sp. NPDC101150]|uniref:hypothetical protein n=1 Tax=Streptomyces sp. NPDC101150 TaxID=3366114 RepID=UPI00381E7E53
MREALELLHYDSALPQWSVPGVEMRLVRQPALPAGKAVSVQTTGSLIDLDGPVPWAQPY